MHHLRIDLRKPPAQRWECLTELAAEVRELLSAFAGDLAAAANDPQVRAIARQVTPEPYLSECDAVARACGVAPEQLLLGNAAYDLLKFRLGCTAIACDSPHGPLHGRNLDWWHSDTLARLTAVVAVDGAPAGPFSMVGWPGYIGTLSGCAPGRFALTMNAVSSGDQPVPTTPIAYVLRRTLEEVATFDAAVTHLATVPLACDALILATGCRPGEMAVIERTPTRHAIRRAEGGMLVATNSYRSLSPEPHRRLDPLLEDSADSRYACASRRLRGERPDTAEGITGILADEQVAMMITAQRMLFQPATGLVRVEPVLDPPGGMG